MDDLKFFNSYRQTKDSNLSKEYKNDYNNMIDLTFLNAPNVFFDVEIEEKYGKNKYKKIGEGVRVDSIFDYNTGELIGDDFKRFIFKPSFETPKYGHKFRWQGNEWLVINTNNLESLSKSVEVRRCNNVLRFIDENGKKIIEPCIMDTVLRFTRNNEITNIVSGNNEQKIWCQKNERTSFIRANQRFLFGSPNNRICFRVYAGGTKNYLNTETTNDTSPSITEFYVEHNEINREQDDLINGFADAFSNKFEIKINSTNNKYITNNTYEITANIFKNKNIIDGDIVWESSDENIAIISEDGLLETLNVGNCQIKAILLNNYDVYDSLEITVEDEISEDYYEIRISPNNNSVLEGTETLYSCYLYENGIKKINTFEFLDISECVPHSNYLITIIDGNNFKIKNKKMYMNKPIKIECKSDIHTKIAEIFLKGVF